MPKMLAAFVLMLVSAGCFLAPHKENNPDYCDGSSCEFLRMTEGGVAPTGGGGGAGGLSGAGGSDGPIGPGQGDVAAPPDGRSGDVAGSCGADQDCPTSLPLCLFARCTKCTSNTDCTGRAGASACNTASGRCVACTVKADCTGLTPACDAISNKCVGCVGDADCSGTKPICEKATNTCAACASGAQCSARNQALPACSSDGACVECTASDAAKCSGSMPVCNATSRKCVACLSHGDCKGADAPICDTSTNTCIPCSMDSQCETKNQATKGCAAGKCVPCSKSEHCGTGAQPICVSNACAGCTADAQCAAKSNLAASPGVCMFHQDGRCATDAETIYVESRSGCSMTTTGGTAVMPLCSAQLGTDVAKLMAVTKQLVVLKGQLTPGFTASPPAGKPLTIVGQGATITPSTAGTGIEIISGEVYLRGVNVKGVNQSGSETGTGVIVNEAATLHMNRCVVENSPGGGIYVNGGGFEITNTAVAGSGPGSLGAVTWGGIYLVPGAGKMARFVNNTIYKNDGGGLTCSAPVSAPGLIAFGTTNAPRDITPSCMAAACCTGDPMLSSTYRLMAGSPCIDKLGPMMSAVDDIDGEPRPKGGMSDCGADEF